MGKNKGIPSAMYAKYSKGARGRKLTLREKKEVKSIVSRKLETKYWPIYQGYTAFSSAGTVFAWSLIPQGTTAETASVRQGDRINLKEIELRFAFNQANTGGAASGCCRLIVFQYRRDNAADPITATVLDTAFTQPLFAPLLPNNALGIKVLYDRTFAVNNATAGPNSVYHRIKLHNMTKKLLYNSSTRGYNQIYGLVIADAAINQPTFAYGGYVRFTDA